MVNSSFNNLIYFKGGVKHKLQFLIGESVIPYNMTVYQAIKQFSYIKNDQHCIEVDSDIPMGKKKNTDFTLSMLIRGKESGSNFFFAD